MENDPDRKPLVVVNSASASRISLADSPTAMKGEPWEYEYVANLLFGANPRSVLVEYEPGNATCYVLLVVPAGAICEVGTDKHFQRGDCVVTWLGNSKSYTFTLGNISTGYLADKLGIENRADADQVALFLNRTGNARVAPH